eukprot:CAMPEP_0170554608 /NCGR_PEP_ID=MMETSP0211-20121228/12480_1 /TAXON_ID=311385 /ORGANISM="Pseudokeronopsis sp., Strain OXSARD2" /LENGTH=42 /DNA_ID= /DNA_START= /DNA_END= /DNA_ORIENTATION=
MSLMCSDAGVYAIDDQKNTYSFHVAEDIPMLGRERFYKKKKA